MKKITHLLTTDEKAKEINFSGKHYGTFAEIGAGQEVARWFFQAGGAAGTVAKSMSAYDMTFSNAIYGTAHRFVSRERLREMLDHDTWMPKLATSIDISVEKPFTIGTRNS